MLELTFLLIGVCEGVIAPCFPSFPDRELKRSRKVLDELLSDRLIYFWTRVRPSKGKKLGLAIFTSRLLPLFELCVQHIDQLLRHISL
jgi:hypothetical protein